MKGSSMKHRAQLAAANAMAQAERVPVPAVRELVGDLCELLVDLAERVDSLEGERGK